MLFRTTRRGSLCVRPYYKALLTLLVVAPFSALAQNYLYEEQPAPATIEEIPSAFDGLDSPKVPPLPGVLIPNAFGLFETSGDWLQDASLYIKPRAYYRHRDEGNGQIREAFAAGGSIEAESGWLYDTFNLGVSMFTSEKIFGPADRDGTGLLQGGQEGYTALGHAFLQARYSSTTAHLYRQELDIPFLNRDDFRMTPKTFEAYIVTAEEPFDIEGLHYGIGHVTRVKDRTATSFVPMSELVGVDGVDRGVSVVGVRYEVTERGLVGFSDQYGWDMFNTFYGQGELVFDIPGTEITTRGAVQFTDQRSVGDELLGTFDTQRYGATWGVELFGLLSTIGFTSTGDEAGVLSPWGGDPTFNSVIIDDFDRAGEDSYRIGMSYDFSHIGLEGLSAFANYVQGSTSDSAPDAEEWNFTVDYHLAEGLLKDLWLRVRSATSDRKGERTREEFRVELNYSIPF